MLYKALSNFYRKIIIITYKLYLFNIGYLKLFGKHFTCPTIELKLVFVI